jgi:hypothetical protein
MFIRSNWSQKYSTLYLDYRNLSLMKYAKLNLFIILFALSVILVPSFALISSSQSNDTLTDETSSNETFSSLSRD